MGSKGVDYFTYTSGPAYKVSIASRGSADQHLSEPVDALTGTMAQNHVEIDVDDIDLFEHTGKFQLSASRNGREIISRYAEIAPTTGNLGSSDLAAMLQTPSYIDPEYAISFGFYDAGANRSHQAYMYVTDNYQSWMSELLAAAPTLRNKPFGTFVLPGSHDAGMFTGFSGPSEARALIHALIAKYATPEKLAMAIAGAAVASLAIPEVVIAGAAVVAAAIFAVQFTDVAERVLINLGYTQKDTIKRQLDLGIRYFDFRPGYNADFYRPDKVVRHQHAFIPGYEFTNFLSDVVAFLGSHPDEVVVAHLKFDGFMDDNMKPTNGVLDKAVKDALTFSGIVKGGPRDLSRTVDDLLATNTRLIILKDADKPHDSYTDAYETDSVDSIMPALDAAMASSVKRPWAVLQLQGTATTVISEMIGAAVTMSDASSPLLATKARFDHRTYPWVVDPQNVAKRCGPDLLVLLNDFADNALVSHCIAVTKQRLG